MRIVFTILLYLLGSQASLSASPLMIDPNICSSEENTDSSCELHCISKGIESKFLNFENFIYFYSFINDYSLQIKKLNLLFKIEPKSNSPPEYLI